MLVCVTSAQIERKAPSSANPEYNNEIISLQGYNIVSLYK